MPAICFHWRFFHHVCTVSVLSVASVIRFRVVSSVVLAFSISIYSEQEVFRPSTCVSWSWDGCFEHFITLVAEPFGWVGGGRDSRACACAHAGVAALVWKQECGKGSRAMRRPALGEMTTATASSTIFLTSHLTMIKITYNFFFLWIPKLYLISRSSCKSDNVTIENNQTLVSFNREFDLCHMLGIVFANDRQETTWFSCPPDAVPVMRKQSPHSGVFRAERRGRSSFSFRVIILISKYEFTFGPVVNSQLQIQASKSLELFVISSPFP